MALRDEARLISASLQLSSIDPGATNSPEDIRLGSRLTSSCSSLLSIYLPLELCNAFKLSPTARPGNVHTATVSLWNLTCIPR